MRRVWILCVALPFAASVPLAQSPDLGVPSRDGLVVCVSAPACDAGASVLAQGGNAVDAAVATAFALAVTHPAAGNIGGGGFMIVRTPSGSVTAFDYREKAPLESTRTMYLGPDGKINRSLTQAGYLAPGVPGTVRGLELAHRKFGKLRWKDVVLPAVGLADGFPISEALALGLNRELEGPMAKFPASVAAFGKPGGGEWAEGDRLVQSDLSRTLRAIADDGADAFYKGWIADRVADDMKANGGLISRKDLAVYRAKERRPVRGRYKGYDIISMPPPSSGGVALVEMLNIVEPFNLKSMGLLTPSALHIQIEVMRRAFLDRARHLGDPDFVKVPVSRLTSKEYARKTAASIDQRKASSSVELGKDIVTVTTIESDDTTHFSVLDRNGLGVTSTYTLEGSYGSHVVVQGAGFLLNNEMGDFNKKPGETNLTGDIGTAANLIDPRKAMLSSMTPTMVIRDGKLVLLTGTPGGRTIINTVFTIVLGVMEYGLTGREAVDLARMHHQWLPDRVSIENRGAKPETVDQLKAMGHEIRTQERQGDAHSIWIAPDGTPYGVPDTRTPDGKASVPQGGATRLTAPHGGR
jgi:gamma-glutamyltranspeptidase/glutathione hydrolase